MKLWPICNNQRASMNDKIKWNCYTVIFRQNKNKKMICQQTDIC